MRRQAHGTISFHANVDDDAARGMFFDGVVAQITSIEFDGEKDGKQTYNITLSEVDASALKLTA